MDLDVKQYAPTIEHLAEEIGLLDEVAFLEHFTPGLFPPEDFLHRITNDIVSAGLFGVVRHAINTVLDQLISDDENLRQAAIQHTVGTLMAQKGDFSLDDIASLQLPWALYYVALEQADLFETWIPDDLF